MMLTNIFRKTSARLSILGLSLTTFGLTESAPAKTPEIEVTKASGVVLTDGLARIDFGMVTVGTTSKRNIVIRNAGTAPLTGLSIVLAGVNKEDFHVSPLPVTSLAPGAKMTVTILLTPSTMGPRAAAIHIKSNDADENPFDIKLGGRGMGRS
jgi:hypothetical protein